MPQIKPNPKKVTLVKDSKGNVIRRRVQIDTGPGLTEQTHKRESDINYILRDVEKTGMISHGNKYEGVYDDVTVQDFQQAIFLTKNIENMFNDLPSGLRKRFENSPKKFIEFTQNPDNRELLDKMHMAKGNDGLDKHGNPIKPPVTTPPAKPVAQPPATKEPPNTA